ncbi:hypothetical protein BDY21DRAFT_350926 [Lineolata rhizophorae]|uniref:Uncharacterized protein n=1 Tax=Lineolata rhizophorae TaxID=578093 RepID=A0A6A6NU46_9PEZI|nr:hypothetical protein BDY21DRAFT_350926 [Lineolata rhizophorae]
MTSAVISTAVSIGVLAYVMVESGRNTDYAFSENDTQRGTYTIESWTCQVRHYAPAYWDRLSRLCHESEAVRWMTIPLVVFSALLFVAALLNMKRDKPSSSSKFELNKFRRDSGNLTNI